VKDRLNAAVNPGRDLEKDVISETGGHFKRVLVSALQGGRVSACA
jgi:hypothetical protein